MILAIHKTRYFFTICEFLSTANFSHFRGQDIIVDNVSNGFCTEIKVVESMES